MGSQEIGCAFHELWHLMQMQLRQKMTTRSLVSAALALRCCLHQWYLISSAYLALCAPVPGVGAE